jgi:hypothetical protein
MLNAVTSVLLFRISLLAVLLCWEGDDNESINVLNVVILKAVMLNVIMVAIIIRL